MFDFLLKVRSKYLVTSDFNTVEKKFLDQGIEKAKVKDYLAKFKDLRDKNKLSGDEKNIDLWGKKTFKDFKSFVDKLIEVKTKTEVKKEARVEGAKLIVEDEDWRVYEITSHKAAMLYGANTKWCITEADGAHYEEYSDKNNIYYLISKTRDAEDKFAKFAVLVDRQGKKTFWDAFDDAYYDIPFNFPKFKMEKPSHVVIDGKRHDDLNNLPQNLKVEGDLDLSGLAITSLPRNLEVGRDLNIQNTSITSLPEGLKVGVGLYLSGTKITSLPEGLSVGVTLVLTGTKITSLPDGLKVGKNIYVDAPAKIECSEALRSKLRSL